MTTTRGFTLIELLVVVAIIGVLATITLASLQTARLKASDATVRSEVIQLRNLMELENTTTGSYTAIKNGSGSGWIASGGSCTGFSGTYASQGVNVCTALVKATGSACGANCVYFLLTNPDSTSKYSIMAYLPAASAAAGSARWFCYGSSGRSTVSTSSLGAWNDPGCYANP